MTTCSNPTVEHPGFPCAHPEYLVSRCSDCGSVKVTADLASALLYIEATRSCIEGASTAPMAHHRWHVEDGSDCWVCCSPDTTVADPTGLATECPGSGQPVGAGSCCRECGQSFGWPHPSNLVVGRPAPSHTAISERTHA